MSYLLTYPRTSTLPLDLRDLFKGELYLYHYNKAHGMMHVSHRRTSLESLNVKHHDLKIYSQNFTDVGTDKYDACDFRLPPRSRYLRFSGVYRRAIVVTPYERFETTCASHRSPLKMRPIGSPETSVRYYHYTLLNIPEKCRSQIPRVFKIISRAPKF